MAPTVADVDRIAATGDPVVRNLEITQCYSDLSAAFAQLTSPGEANWCTFATWASKQAGQTIRKQDLTRSFERIFGQSPEAASIGNNLVEAVGEVASGAGRFWDAARKAVHPDDAFERASDAVARGNRKVFDEIGRQFAAFLALTGDGRTIDPDAFGRFREALRPGDPPDGQGYLRQAFDAYMQAIGTTDAKARAELMLLGNLAIGYHEQTRLQPEIAEALDAPFQEPLRLRRDLFKHLARLQVGLAARLLLQLLPGRGTGIKEALAALDRKAREVAHQAVTERLMTLAVPGHVFDLGRDVPGAFPERLLTIADPRLRDLLGRIDPTPDTTRGSGARDWSLLPERIHFIADLFRVTQEASLYEAPFTPEQVAVIRAGGRPAGRL